MSRQFGASMEPLSAKVSRITKEIGLPGSLSIAKAIKQANEQLGIEPAAVRGEQAPRHTLLSDGQGVSPGPVIRCATQLYAPAGAKFIERLPPRIAELLLVIFGLGAPLYFYTPAARLSRNIDHTESESAQDHLHRGPCGAGWESWRRCGLVSNWGSLGGLAKLDPQRPGKR